MLQTLFITAPFVIALLLALALAMGPFALQGMVRKWSDTWRAATILWLIAISAVLNVVLVPRRLIVDPDTAINMAGYLQGAAAASWLSRLFTLGLVGFSLTMLLSAWLSRSKERQHDPVWSLGILLGMYYLLSILIGATVAGVPSFEHKSLYIPIVLGAMIALPRIDFPRLLVQLKLILALVMAMNLVAAVMFPDFALLRPYSGQLPGVDFRLFGVFSHANTLGPIALLLLLLELYYPARRPLLRWSILLLALANFLLAQSKTTWLAAFAILLFVYVPYQFMAAQSRPKGFASAVVLILLLIAGLMGGMFALLGIGLDRIFSEEVLSLTGRTSIWTVTLEEFSRYPVFGYGPELWGREYRLTTGILGAGQAHNQFVQTLGESGLVGFALLMAYLGILMRFAFATFRQSRGLSLALYGLILARCMTEAPLRGAINDWSFFIHATLLVVLVSYARKSAAALSRDAPSGMAAGWPGNAHLERA